MRNYGNRRAFFKTAAALVTLGIMGKAMHAWGLPGRPGGTAGAETKGAASGGAGGASGGAGGASGAGRKGNAETGKKPPGSVERLSLRYRPYTLQLKHTFTLASGSRTTTPVMLTRIEYDGITGYGEASMPPYLGETQQTATRFLEKVRLGQFTDPFRMEEILAYVDQLEPGNNAAKASVDIALHDLVGKLLGAPWYRIWGYNREDTPYTSMTIGIDSEEIVKQKVREAAGMKILKVKLGRGNDREMIRWVRELTGVTLCVDVNQGWTERHEALELIHWLKEQGVIFVEQPMPKQQVDDQAWLTERSPLPVVADESVQRMNDLKELHGAYSGVNIKLMKSTGMREAYKMIHFARATGMKILMGCMTETSCGISAAAQLSPLADWADLDGNLLIKNDPFHGMEVIEGKVTLNDLPGIGVEPVTPAATSV